VLADALAELWLRDGARTAYRRAAVGGSAEEKEAARRGQEALAAAGPAPDLAMLIREAAARQLEDVLEGARLWQRAVAQATVSRVPTPPVVWSGHDAPVDALAWGGARLATASRDRTIKVWDAASGRGLVNLAGHADRVTAVAFSPDGSLLVSGAADRTVRVWDVASGQARAHFSAHQNVVSAVAFSPDGQRLATGGWDAQVKLWSVTGAPVATLSGHGDSIVRLAFSRDGRRLATLSRDGVLRVWDAVTGGASPTKVSLDDVTAMALAPGGAPIVARSDGSVARWDLGASRIAMTYVRRGATVRSLSLDSSGRTLLLGEGRLRRFDVGSGRPMPGAVPPTDHAMGLLSADGTRAAALSQDQPVLWSFQEGKEIRLGSLGPPITSLSWSATGLVAASAAALTTWRSGQAPVSAPHAGLLVAGGPGLLIRKENGSVIVKVATDGVSRTLPESARGCVDLDLLRGGSTGSAEALVLGYARPPCGERAVQLWGAAPSPSFLGPPHGVQALAVTADGRSLVTVAVARRSSLARPEGQLAVWSLAGGAARVDIRVRAEVAAVAVSVRGLVATGGREIVLWRLGSLTQVRVLPAPSPVTSLAFSPDGRRVAAGHQDGAVSFWDAATGQRLGLLVITHQGRWAYASEEGRFDGDEGLFSLSLAGAVTPAGLTRPRLAALSPL
jgi:WD40 repeat protein